METDSLWMLAVAAVGLIVVFDYTNGFHDASNIIATVIASRAMSPARDLLSRPGRTRLTDSASTPL